VTAAVNVLARLLLGRIGTPRARRKWLKRTAPVAPPSAELTAARTRRAATKDHVMTGVLGTALVLTVVPLFLILGYITIRGATALDWNFFTKLPRGPTRPESGLAHALVGSGILVGLAALLATPVGLLAAILLAEFRNSKLANAVRFVVELLGGVPSIV